MAIQLHSLPSYGAEGNQSQVGVGHETQPPAGRGLHAFLHETISRGIATGEKNRLHSSEPGRSACSGCHQRPLHCQTSIITLWWWIHNDFILDIDRGYQKRVF
jgi:hypothetical protein